MTKILTNKKVRAFLALALTALLVATMVPHFSPAYGDDVLAAGEATLPAEDAAADDAEGAEGPDAAPVPDAPGAEGDGEEADDAPGAGGLGTDGAPEADAPVADGAPDGGSAGAFDQEVTDAAPAPGDGADAALAADATADEAGDPATQADERAISGTKENVDKLAVKAGETSTATLRYTNNKTYTLTVDGTLNGTIYITGGATLNLEGSGTIDGKGAPTVIHVEGGNSTLNVNKAGGRITITGGKGGTTLNDGKNFKGYQAGGGILVERTDPSGTRDDGTPATLNFYNGTVTGNTAGAGGGIFVDRGCAFYMADGTVTNNTATTHEAGGIYVGSRRAAADGYRSGEHSFIAAGTITGNKTQTTIDWGGGGIFVESRGVLKLGTARITKNSAQGLGGGVSGCPHAVIGMGSVTNQAGAAIWNNTASKATLPNNSYLSISQDQSGQRFGDMYAYGTDTGKVSFTGRTDVAGLLNKPYSKNAFTKDYAQDYYCTKVTAVTGPNVSAVPAGGNVWKGYAATSAGGAPFTIKKGEVRAFSTGSVGLTSLLPASYDPGRRAVVIERNTSSTHGGGIGCNGTLLMGELGTQTNYNSFSFDFSKKLQNTLGNPVDLGGRAFTFELSGHGQTYRATSDEHGRVSFTIDAKPYLEGAANGQQKELSFTLTEKKGDAEGIVYDEVQHQVKVKFTVKISQAEITGAVMVTSVTADDVTVTIDGKAASDFAVTNTLQLRGAWAPEATKYFHGATAPEEPFSFTLQELAESAVADLGQVNLRDVKADGAVQTKGNGAFSDSPLQAAVAFDAIDYTEPGTHWYRITEDGGADPVVYVARVEVAEAADHESLVATRAALYYADDLDATVLTELSADDVVEFHNAGSSSGALSFSSYRAFAASGEPMERKCLVDPKIFKQLDGRTLKGGEFSFQLVRATDDYEPTGEVISETVNDQYGMVDFDAAANVAGEGEEPSCLLFTQPGTYRYRVIEDPNFQLDPSIDYSPEVITFTAVIDEVDGALRATDMYYGRLVNGENVREEESADPKWHPTITNRAKPMDLAVRKTSVLDRDQGLEGATYGLFMVNHNEQDDVFLASAVSDAEGWIYFENVNLAEGNLYYFREQAAPAGHTVSEFRSSYFYLEQDKDAEMGFVLRYTDSKSPWGDEAQVAAAASADGEAGEGAAGSEGAAGEGAGEPLATPATTGKDGALLFVYEKDGGVYDEATVVEFNKLDTRTHEWVEGAKLSVREKETGRVVASWTSGAAPERLEAVLNVGTVYVLREDAAPEGYEKAGDVEFSIDEYGSVRILAGTANGNAELSDSTITLYDTRIPVEQVITETRERVREVPGKGEERVVVKKSDEKLARTGDALALGAIALVAVTSLAVLLTALRRRKRGNHAE